MATVEDVQGRINPTSLRRVVAGAILGGTIEWFDYFIYASAAALIFGKLFFAGASPLVGTLASFGTFAVGQLMRPIGAIVLGNLGDKIGRKPILVTTFILMGGSTFIIGLLPTYGTVGVLAPILLVLFRLLQGFGAGAEYAGASIMMLEYAPPNRRGLYGSTGSIGSAAGLMFGTLVFTLLQLLPDSALLSWGWRLPFIVSAALVAVGLWVRTRVDESPMFEQVEQQKQVERLPLKGLVLNERKSLVQIFALAAGLQMGTYVFLTYIITYLKGQAHFAAGTATYLVFFAGIAAVIVTPLFGRLSDSIGRRVVFGGAALLAAICVFPYFALIDTGNVVLAGVAVVVLGGIVIQAMAGVQGSLFGEVFSTKLRYSGFAVGREVSAAIFGGLSPLIATALVAAAGGSPWAVSIYLIAVLLLTFVATLLVPETYKSALKL
ncbi:MAG TPA: MFS transporter [Pseudonocardiaceae bacterium]|nr:MFS transporter [Pseudonocardiaceae bacterium]